MTCCYLIQSHTNPAQVLRLVSTVKRSSPGAWVLVVHDGRRIALDPEPFRRWPGVEVLVRKDRVERGEISVLSPLFAGLEELLGGKGGRPRWSFDWLVYLSAQDYPVRPVADIETALAATMKDGFLTYWDIDQPGGPWKPRQGPTRYHAQYCRLADWTLGPLKALRFLGKISPLRFHLHYGPFMGWQPRHTPFDVSGDRRAGSTRCYAGWQWWTLSRPCVEHLWDALCSDDRLVRWFRHTIAPCEALVHSVLVNSGRFDLVPDNRRYADFGESRDGRPRTLNENDLQRITAGRFDFARKFDMAADAELLDVLDARVLGLDPRT